MIDVMLNFTESMPRHNFFKKPMRLAQFKKS